MKKFSLGFTVGALIALVISSAVAQQPKFRTEKLLINPNDPSDITRVSPDWKQVSEDIGFRLYTDSHGMRRARLEVRLEDRWQPVAVDGREDFLPLAVPVR